VQVPCSRIERPVVSDRGQSSEPRGVEVHPATLALLQEGQNHSLACHMAWP
jgi:hypothetical protein